MRKKLSLHDAKKTSLFLITLFFVCFYLVLQTDLHLNSELIFARNETTQDISSSYTIKTAGCSIPYLDPYDPSIIKFVTDEEPEVVCNSTTLGLLVKSNVDSIYIDHQVLERANLSSNISCCYRPFWRLTAADNQSNQVADTLYKYAEQCVQVEEKTGMKEEEFVRVECQGEGLQYKDFHAFVPQRLVEAAAVPSADTNVSVLIIGIDGVSRLNFHRQMPKTFNFLKQNTNLVEFFGFNKVGDNTFPNLLALLTGKSEKEVIETCWPETNAFFDNCSFIWDHFKTAGFVTGFGEDASWMGMFNYLKVGFKNQPTDFYLKIFNQVSEKEMGYEKRLNANLCVGTRLSIEIVLDVVLKFSLRLLEKLSFGFFWSNSLSHDFLNLPKYGDDYYVDTMRKLLENDVFNKTIVFVMSDHGIRWGDIRTTYQGYLEERLPLLLISYPTWFKERYTTAVSNLHRNAKKLTTPFDIYDTLVDLTHLESIHDRTVKGRSIELREGNYMRGISLFLSIPDNRTCQHAQIEDHWCTCHKSEQINTNSTDVRQSANFLVDYINSMLSGYRECAKLKLNRILSARIHVLPSPPTESSYKTDFSLRIETVPGNALFEASVSMNKETNKFQVLSTISRSNSYGKQSRCISHYKLKLYCYCK